MKFEINLGSEYISGETIEDDVLLPNNINYPFSNYPYGPTLEFLRKSSILSVPVSVKYYFSRKDSVLKFLEMSWNCNNYIDIYSPTNIKDPGKCLDKEANKSDEYKRFFNKLNSKISGFYGKPTKRVKEKKWDIINSNGYRYEWLAESYSIITKLRYPIEGNVNLIFVSYFIAWK